MGRLDTECFKFSSKEGFFFQRNSRMVVFKEFCNSKPKVVQDFKPTNLSFVLVFQKKGQRNISLIFWFENWLRNNIPTTVRKQRYVFFSQLLIEKKICNLFEPMLQNITTLLSSLTIIYYFYKYNLFISKEIFIGKIDKTQWRKRQYKVKINKKCVTILRF